MVSPLSACVTRVVYHLHGKPTQFELNREEPGTGKKIEKM
jgi:hypothetical protein